MAASVPYIPPERTLAEITVKGVILAVVLSVVLGAANVYLGLKVGLTVSASIPAAVISMAVLRAFRRHNILENNAVQTAASAGEALAAGVLFTVPALLILGHWSRVSYWETTTIALVGGVLGVLFTVPLRRALIVEAELLFPEGVATSEVLKAGEPAEEPSVAGDGRAAGAAGTTAGPKTAPGKTTAGKTTGSTAAAAKRGGKGQAGPPPAAPPGVDVARAGIVALITGALVAFVYKALQGGMHVWAETAAWGRRIGDRGVVAFGSDLSPALLGVGYIVGLRIASLVFLGGVIGWLVAIPVYSLNAEDTVVVHPQAGPLDWVTDQFDAGASAVDVAGLLWSTQIRYMGVGAMLVGGLWALLKLRRPLGQALMQGFHAGSEAERERSQVRTEREFGTRATFLGVLGMVVPIFALYWYATDSVLVALVMAGLMVVTGFLFSAVGAYMAGIVGSSNNPISGVTILTVLASAFTLKFMGVDSSLGPAATIYVAAVIACAGAIASDNMQDLKAGHLLGATPRKQQIMQLVGVSAAAFALAPVLQILHDGFTIGSPQLSAPQATLMAAVGGFVFEGGLPVAMVATGAVIAVALIVLDEVLAAARAPFRTPVMPVAVGIYLPVGLSAPIFLGGLVAFLLGRRYLRDTRIDRPGRGASWWQETTVGGLRSGTLFASGLIAGEALLGILLALGLSTIGEDRGGVTVLPFALESQPLVWPGLLMFGYLIVLLVHFVRRPARA